MSLARLVVSCLAASLAVACASTRADSIAPDPSTAAAPPPTTVDAPAKSTDAAGPGKYADVHGLRIYYVRRGTGPTMLLLHGGLGTVAGWPEALDYFAQHYDVIAPEQMGHGHTADDSKRAFSYHAMAEDTIELLKQLHVDKALVLGWSDGGDIAIDLAINHPTLVKKLATSGANIHAITDPGTVAFVKSLKPICGPGDKAMETCLPPMIHDDYVKAAPDPKHFVPFVQRVETMWFAEPKLGKSDLAKITSPALIIAGDHDMIAIDETAEIFKSIPNAQLWIVPNATHDVPQEKAAQFNETVRAFFEEPTPAK